MDPSLLHAGGVHEGGVRGQARSREEERCKGLPGRGGETAAASARVLDLLLYYLLGWAKARFAPSAMRLAAQSNRSEKIDTGVVTKEKGSALVAL
jgi:hypothetical protein